MNSAGSEFRGPTPVPDRVLHQRRHKESAAIEARASDVAVKALGSDSRGAGARRNGLTLADDGTGAVHPPIRALRLGEVAHHVGEHHKARRCRDGA